MKNLFTIILLLAVSSAQSQYFQQRFNLDYTTPQLRNERCNSGIITRENYAGGNRSLFYFAGIGTSYNNTALPAPDNVADRMRFQQLNNVGTAVISNLGYQFADAAGLWFNSYGNSIAEVKNTANTGGYVTVGAVTNDTLTGSTSIAGNSDALFTQLTSAGGVVTAVRYDVSGGSERAWCIRKSNVLAGKQATWIICGESKQTKNNTVCFVARVLVNGTIVWFNTYSFDPSGGAFNSSINIAKQLCEDPAGNIYVAGTVQDVPAAANGIDALAFKLTPAGAVVWVRSYQAFTDDEYQAIRFTADGNIVLGGFTNFGAAAPVTSHVLIAKLSSANGAIIFQNILRARKGNKTYTSKCYDIIETTGPQYFLAGPITAGGINYEMMYKANAVGLGVNWYIYNQMNYNVGFGLDSSNVGATTGIAYFSSMKNPAVPVVSDSHIMKTDYFGRTCNFCTAYLPYNIQLNMEVHQHQWLIQQNAKTHQLVWQLFKYENAVICNTPAINCQNLAVNDAQDANAKKTAGKTPAINISPNPVTSLLHLQFSNIEAGKYSIMIVNRSGSIVMQKTNTYLDNASTLNLNVSSLPQEIYLVRISNGTKVLEQKLLKE